MHYSINLTRSILGFYSIDGDTFKSCFAAADAALKSSAAKRTIS